MFLRLLNSLILFTDHRTQQNKPQDLDEGFQFIKYRLHILLDDVFGWKFKKEYHFHEELNSKTQLFFFCVKS
jgi:hypothetical protein